MTALGFEVSRPILIVILYMSQRTDRPKVKECVNSRFKGGGNKGTAAWHAVAREEEP